MAPSYDVTTRGGSCCERFCAYHREPEAFFRGTRGLDQDRLSRGDDGERRVTVTARGLFLTRDLLVQHDTEPSYDAERGGHHVPRWDHDTYLGGLALPADAALLASERILDVASGLALAPTELSVLGATVDCVDLEVDDAHRGFSLTRPRVVDRHAEQLELLRCLARHAEHPRYTMSEPLLHLLDTLLARSSAIASAYPRVSGARRRGDATTLDDIADGTYDRVMCGWLLVHLEPDDERRAVASLLRVTRLGGHVHVRAGYGGELRDRVRRELEGARALLARDDLLVLERTSR